MKFFRTATFVAALVGAGSLLATAPARAQEWPSRPVKIVVPFPAGGSTDRMGRLIADELSRVFKQQFYVENRAGAGGSIAASQVVRAEPDGYTLMIGGFAPFVLGPAANPNIGYDPLADFTHIAMIGGDSYVFAAHSSLGVKTLADLVAMTKRQTGPMNCGSPGAGTLGQLMVELLRRRAGIPNLNHVPYRGGAALANDLLGNHISLAAIPTLSILEHIPTGSVVPLAVSTTERLPALKDIPTFAELGYPDVGGTVWFWLAGPKNLPSSIVNQLGQEIPRYLKTAQVKERFEREAMLSMDVDRTGLNKFVADELKRWTSLIEDLGLKTK